MSYVRAARAHVHVVFACVCGRAARLWVRAECQTGRKYVPAASRPPRPPIAPRRDMARR